MLASPGRIPLGMTTFSSVRITKFTERTQLQAASTHALRMDSASRRRLRPGAQPGTAIAVSTRRADGVPSSDFVAMRDVATAFDAHLARTGAKVGQGSGGMGFHAMVTVSPEWISADGEDPHSKGNKRNQELLRGAVGWVESWCGQGSVYCCRVDLDEEGAGVVDVFAAPTRPDGRSNTLRISTSKALAELRRAHRERMSFVALQSDWASYCQQHLDAQIRRGRPKAETRAEHLEVDEFKQAATEASRRLHSAIERAERTRSELWELLDAAKAIEMTVQERNAMTFIEREALERWKM